MDMTIRVKREDGSGIGAFAVPVREIEGTFETTTIEAVVSQPGHSAWHLNIVVGAWNGLPRIVSVETLDAV